MTTRLKILKKNPRNGQYAIVDNRTHVIVKSFSTRSEAVTYYNRFKAPADKRLKK